MTHRPGTRLTPGPGCAHVAHKALLKAAARRPSHALQRQLQLQLCLQDAARQGSLQQLPCPPHRHLDWQPRQWGLGLMLTTKAAGSHCCCCGRAWRPALLLLLLLLHQA